MNITKIRQDFPILNPKNNKESIIYLDNACTSLRPVQVIEKMNEYYKEYPSCGNRSMHRFGIKVTEEVEKSRDTIKKFINAESSSQIVFTKNSTEGINLIANSLDFNKNDKILTSDKEHNSNLIPWQLLSSRKGVKHQIINSNSDNSLNLEDLYTKIKGAKLVSIVHVSNLDGCINPIKEITKIAHENNSLVLVDAAQSAPHKEINMKNLCADFLVFSGHKMLGPSGTGVLYGRSDLLKNLNPFIVGGETVNDSTYKTFSLADIPEKFEAGLQDYAGIIGLGEAASYLLKIGKEDICKHELKLNKIITENLSPTNKIKIIGPADPSQRSGIFSCNINHIDCHDAAVILDRSFNIMLRSGMHCVNSWFNSKKINGCLRASLYLYNTEEECGKFIEAVNSISNINP